MKSKLILWALALVIISCDSDDEMEMPNPPTNNYVLVGNEGGLNANNASLTTIDRSSMDIEQNVFSVTNGELLGDVLHSVAIYNNEIYAVVNNSGRIEVLGKDSLNSHRTIIDLDSPRFIQFLSESKAYVSDYVANGLHIINPTTGTYNGFMNTGTWLEEMVLLDGEVWATGPGGDKVYVIDPATDMLTDSVQTGEGATSIEIDGDGNVWVLSQGTFNEPIIQPSIHKIDPGSRTVSQSFVFPEGTGYGGLIEASADGDFMYYLIQNKVFRMPTNATALPQEPFINPGGTFLYGLNVNNATGEIALTDAVDFSQSGQVYFYDNEGNALNDYPAGIAPKAVLWVNN
jgi:hypothetical protein